MAFDGSSNITVTADATTLTGSYINSTVTGSSLTSVGTLTGGTWNATTISPGFGGTGMNNGLNTISLGGNLSTAGALYFSGSGSTTFATTGTTTVTLPTTGVLATLNGAETLTSKTLTTPILTSPVINTSITGSVVVDGAHGGTGVNNGTNTITLGGPLTTVGSYTLGLTTNANTSVTLPASGTLATLAGSETFTNKTLTSPVINTAITGSVVVDGTHGGTGVNNGSKTITLGGNLTTSGANDVVFATSGSTSVTLPTTGTLATLLGTETFENKTYKSPKATGSLLINTTTNPSTQNASPTLALVSGAGEDAVMIVSSTSGNNVLNMWQKGTNNFTAVAFYKGDVQTFIGGIGVSTSAVSYNTTSDYRLKTDFRDFNGTDLLDSIKVYDYQWKIDSSRSYGVKAHELQKVIPYAVTGQKDETNLDGSIKAQSVDYSKLVPVLIKSLQEQKSIIQDKQNMIDLLESRIKKIELQLNIKN